MGKYYPYAIKSIRRSFPAFQESSFPGIQIFRETGRGELPILAEIATSAVFGGRDGCPHGPGQSGATRAGLGRRFAPES